ncbi:MAG: SDR family NAD(P)-dependent oxidoreductase [Patescibacteria group bacterium]|nr:SDR family NAD(P)-dependent oxidoreductase [Patescibacteria group bacterium]MDD5294968.1 SDR family NAD(P)-dependent oxidoreductase [Patescibacteria group bacterium]MDD5554078.1 SDR family NAD(P)-dependent oxidoreductase [Patescibacteria group bacterium]
MKENIFTQNQEVPKKERFIITGGTEGIGKAITDELLKEGADIAICARTQEKIDSAKKNPDLVSAYQLDLADRHAAKKFIKDSIADLGGLDVLILNAAVTGMKEDDEYVFKVNEVAQVALTKAAAEALKESGGRVVFLTSAAKNVKGAEAYGKSKKRIEEWLKNFSDRPENKDIKIFSVIPGTCDTRIPQEFIKYGGDEIRARAEDIIKRGGFRNPETIGKIISKMSISGNKFNPKTGEYDIPINQCEVVTIDDDNIEAEEKEEFKQKLEWIKGLKLSFEDKISLLLMLKGIKPACAVSGEIDTSPIGLFSQVEEAETRVLPTTEQIEYLRSIGVNMPEPEVEFSKSHKVKSTIIAKTKEILDELEQLQNQLKKMPNPRHPKYYETHYKIGKLFGYPESCLAKLGTATDDKIKVPEHLRPLKQFVFSKDNWEEELKTLESWYEQIKDLIPEIK